MVAFDIAGAIESEAVAVWDSESSVPVTVKDADEVVAAELEAVSVN